MVVGRNGPTVAADLHTKEAPDSIRVELTEGQLTSAQVVTNVVIVVVLVELNQLNK